MRPDDITPHPKNAPGDFYVEDNCCLACGVPQIVAPDLFPIMDDSFEHCFVKKQPSNQMELEQMLDSVKDSELACIRYRGTDPQTLAKIARMGEGSVCDELTK